MVIMPYEHNRLNRLLHLHQTLHTCHQWVEYEQDWLPNQRSTVKVTMSKILFIILWTPRGQMFGKICSDLTCRSYRGFMLTILRSSVILWSPEIWNISLAQTLAYTQRPALVKWMNPNLNTPVDSSGCITCSGDGIYTHQKKRNAPLSHS